MVNVHLLAVKVNSDLGSRRIDVFLIGLDDRFLEGLDDEFRIDLSFVLEESHALIEILVVL